MSDMLDGSVAKAKVVADDSISTKGAKVAADDNIGAKGTKVASGNDQDYDHSTYTSKADMVYHETTGTPQDLSWHAKVGVPEGTDAALKAKIAALRVA